MHGNEPSGAAALAKVFDKLRAKKPPVNGRFIALRGNVQGLAKKERYLDNDLNRIWFQERIEALEKGEVGERATAEEAEQIGLYKTLHKIIKTAQRDIYVVDLHTTSSASKPFAIFGDTIRNRNFAKRLRASLILGLEEAITGTLIEYITNLGHVALAFEAGQHEAPDSVDKHEAAVWMALEASGVMSRKDISGYKYYAEILANEAKGLPEVLEVRYRHAIKPDDDFQMEPGYVNFQRVKEGQLLARDRNGGIWAPKNFHVFMPLYQGLGDDGFFLAKPVKLFWLTLSKYARRFHADALLRYLPGISKHPRLEHTYRVNTKIARWLVMEIFHLLVYRRERNENGVLVVNKRKYDFFPPTNR
jgi:succinylglutamate desuccinylase